MKYLYVFICILYMSSLKAADEYMVIGPEYGGEGEMCFEPTPDRGDSPKSDMHENDNGEVY